MGQRLTDQANSHQGHAPACEQAQHLQGRGEVRAQGCAVQAAPTCGKEGDRLRAARKVIEQDVDEAGAHGVAAVWAGRRGARIQILHSRRLKRCVAEQRASVCSKTASRRMRWASGRVHHSAA